MEKLTRIACAVPGASTSRARVTAFGAVSGTRKLTPALGGGLSEFEDHRLRRLLRQGTHRQALMKRYNIDVYRILYYSSKIADAGSEFTMQIMTYTDARKGMKAAMDTAVQDRDPVVITRKNGGAVVMISLEEYNAICETLHLVQSPENARRLRKSIGQLDAGAGLERALGL